MGNVLATLDAGCREFISKQHVFFVATAPVSGHLNLSPKGLDSFRVLSETRVAYLDQVGSGVETIAHLRENGRIVVMFCAFEGPPRILRLHGRGRAVESGDAEWPELVGLFPERAGTRAVIVVEVERVSTSCGYGVPLLRFEGEREQMTAWARKKGPEGLRAYEREKNARSVDGLPGLRRATSSE